MTEIMINGVRVTENDAYRIGYAEGVKDACDWWVEGLAAEGVEVDIPNLKQPFEISYNDLIWIRQAAIESLIKETK